MRVTQKIIYSHIIENLGNITEDIKNLNEMISSGKKIRHPSDDPIGTVNILEIKKLLSSIKQYRRNIEFGNNWLRDMENVIQNSMETLVRAKEIAVQMANETYNASQRKDAAMEIDAILREMLSLANSKFQKKYIFSGYKTDTSPFEVTENADGKITNVTYNGDKNSIKIKTSQNSYVKIGKCGTEIFGEETEESYAFSVLIRLRDALENNDISGIQNELDNLDQIHQRLSNNISDIGAKMNRLEIRKNIFSQSELDLQERLSTIQDTDIAEAITMLKSKEAIYQAALLSSTKITQISLVNYL